ncbi:hypothetical protein [Pseudomonas syringae]|uniref:hypothetical protein n=1 Tax=Pseudomonas syringae TaxID=317 RepID=UPI0002099A9D|nr:MULTISPECIES: hypothetical protein [Pseudomonas syringae group]EGH97636.1 hypothetical protein PLA106_16169 [Pseudomonas amygdali pv. lachrymans str. M302278]PYD04666.1 hypothetical protein DND90_11225 [Pseudomonas syringae pv. maculicola]RMM16880.1 hypothetical protein ALQ85_03920 [Pseudomonas syringae]
MTTTQICVLIGLIISAGLLLWFGYMIGLSDGIKVGITKAEQVPRAQDVLAIHEFETSLRLMRTENEQLARHCERLQRGMAFGAQERDALNEIAEKLRIAAETFSAFRTGKKLERDCLTLRQQALQMAEALVSDQQVNAA